MTAPAHTATVENWPELPLAVWQDTLATLHMWTQIVGKIRLGFCPHVNHWWEVPLYVNSVGLTTSPIPWARGVFEVQFDFIRQNLSIQTSEGQSRTIALRPRSVADFYREFLAELLSLGIDAKIWHMPVEIPNPIAFDRDTQHASYDPAAVTNFWRALVTVEKIFQEFRAGFLGKVSPVHFFWGSFDLAVTRFSGRRAPERENADPVTREAYSHEVISAGFWPGGGEVKGAAFYTYAAPEPVGFGTAPVRPKSAFYSQTMKEFLLMYDDVRSSPSPRGTLLEFLQTTYDAGADLGKWDRKELERAA
jgi:Family of unknown function (DUF5996)